NRLIGAIIAVCFGLSFLFSRLAALSGISGGTKTIILIVVISAIASILFPVADEDDREDS
ncbi:MAG: branched-chain amino acid ABC transporter permease, partial [Lachnospiraceae bacterium]|nr:branched-chain amino acid ABC transporter permease [Lachnospiraceae bacterium]